MYKKSIEILHGYVNIIYEDIALYMNSIYYTVRHSMFEGQYCLVLQSHNEGITLAFDNQFERNPKQQINTKYFNWFN